MADQLACASRGRHERIQLVRVQLRDADRGGGLDHRAAVVGQADRRLHRTAERVVSLHRQQCQAERAAQGLQRPLAAIGGRALVDLHARVAQPSCDRRTDLRGGEGALERIWHDEGAHQRIFPARALSASVRDGIPRAVASTGSQCQRPPLTRRP
jgi:hypothetical protein